MRKTLTTLAFLLALPAGAASADDGCAAPMAEWRPREAVQRLATREGWRLDRLRVHDGCYVIDATDPTGARIRLRLDPATLAPAAPDGADDHDE
jgi:hypothetical protein